MTDRHTSPRRRPILRAATLAVLLTVVSIALTAFVLPNPMPRLLIGPSMGEDGLLWWTDGTRGGRYRLSESVFASRVRLARIIFAGAVDQQPFFNQNPPPDWAGAVSLDMREGFEEVQSVAVGWPFRAFAGQHWIAWEVRTAPPNIQVFPFQSGSAPPAAVPAERFEGLSATELSSGRRIMLPYRPIWRGLVLNLLIYGTGWFALILGPYLLRRHLRQKSGKCPGCGYDPAGPATSCPECGERLSGIAARSGRAS
ncbi:MAG: hypothetical protein ACT4PL_07400 [Phycisphaerales bacterium]